MTEPAPPDTTEPMDTALWLNCRDKLDGIEALTADWDSYGAEPIARDIITTTSGLLAAMRAAKLRPPDEIVPSGDGAIVLAWEAPPGLLEIEIEPCGSIVVSHG